MANDYMAKLIADLEGMSMMREPEPMVMVSMADGGYLDDLASKGRYGDTMIAHINPQEAEMLMEEGGSGTINPMTGLPEFYDIDIGADADSYDYSADAASVDAAGDTGDGGANQGGNNDGTYTEEQLTTLATLPGLTDLPYTDEGLGGDKFTLDPYNVRTGIQQQKQEFNKEGIPKEFVPYYNSLKDRGLSNEQAMATLAAVAGTPGGAGALSSGYTDGYSYGGPMGTLEDLMETGQTASLERRAKKAKEEAAKEEQEVGYLAGGVETETEKEPGIFGDLFNFDDFSLGSLNPLSIKVTPEQQAVLDSYSALGLEVKGPSVMGNILGGIGSSLLSTPMAVAKYVGEQLTDTDIIGLATDPVTGFEYLIESGGGLQLAADQLGDAPNQDAGNEPTITKKRKVATEKPKEEEKKEEEEKDYFPKQKLPRLSQSGLETLQYAYRNDPPEVLDNILNKYTLPDQTSGLKALV
jgi:hypothetical protein